MCHDGFDLERLLMPVHQSDFLRDCWEKQSFVVHREDRRHYGDLFSLVDLDSVIAFTRPGFMPGGFANGQGASRCVQGWHPDQPGAPTDVYPDIARLHEAYGQGKTVIIRGMQQRWPAVATLCRNLESFFHCPVHGNLYLTPANSQGFDAHFDAHEVFALQLHGVKHWRLYGSAAVPPLASEKASVPRSCLGPAQEVRLDAGDLLYIPRGHAHEAFTADRPSLHLTVGVNVYRWADLLLHALKELTRRDPRFRESLPRGITVTSSIEARNGEYLKELLQVLADEADPDAAACGLGNEFFDKLPMLPRGHFVAPSDIDSLDLDTVVGKSPGALCRTLMNNGQATIQFPGGQMAGPARIASALQFIAQTGRFAIRELPDSLGDDGKRVLCRRLIREGLLMIHSREESNGEAKRSALSEYVDATMEEPAQLQFETA